MFLFTFISDDYVFVVGILEFFVDSLDNVVDVLLVVRVFLVGSWKYGLAYPSPFLVTVFSILLFNTYNSCFIASIYLFLLSCALST